jgi:hypothetical protein
MDEEPEPRFKTVMEYIAGAILFVLLSICQYDNAYMLYPLPQILLVFLVVILILSTLYQEWLQRGQKKIKASLMQYTIKQKFLLLLKIAGVGAFLLFIWPTPYEYIRDTRPRAELWRVNRFTGLKQQATKTGWRSEAEISDEYNRAKNIKEAEEALLAKRKEYPTITFGSNNEYRIKFSTAFIKSSFIGSDLVWEAEISPYEGALEDYCRTQSGTGAVEIVLLNEQGFEFRRLLADHSSPISDGKGGYPHLHLTGRNPMSSSNYKAIKSFTLAWRF